MTDLTEAARLAPTDAEVRIDLSALMRRAGRPKDALAALDGVGKAGAVLPAFHRERGLVLKQLGTPVEAAAAFSAAIAAGSIPADYKNRAACLLAAGERDRAAADLKVVLDRGPDVEALTLRGQLYEDLGNRTAAVADWDKAARLAPADPGVLVGYARALNRAGRHEEAHNALDGALYLAKDFKPARDLHRTVLRDWVAVDPTVVGLDRDLKAKPGDADLLLKRARRLRVMGAEDQAAADLATVLKVDPNNATALWLRAGTPCSTAGMPTPCPT